VKFSIITPSFKQLDWLRLCVASVKDQIDVATNEMRNAECGMQDAISEIKNQKSKIPPLAVEHIIQDAGSPGIEDFAREVGADFYREGTLISHSPFHIPNYSLAIFAERDEGMYDAINRGLRRSTGDVCAWLNSDEQYLPGTLRKMATVFQRNPGIEVAVGDTVLLNDKLEPKAYRKAVAPDRRYIQIFQMNLHSSSLFFRRTILDRGHWFGDRFRSIGDAEWVAGLLDAGVRFHCIPGPVSTFVLGAGNLSRNAISEVEVGLWRSETRVTALGKFLLKATNAARRFTHGAYFPRRAGILIFMFQNIGKRTRSPERWLDFRFRV
jgi:glycosyltransferase involved in cell wall biosynthesis